jgi:tetratricopeptide (TPR) repeat protein
MDGSNMDLTQLLESALRHHRAGAFALADALYGEMLAIDPTCFDAWHLRGVLARQTGNPEVAIQLITRALSLNNREPAVFNNLGVAFQAAGRLEEAETSYRHALDLMPDYADAWYNLGVVLMAAGHYRDAERSYLNAIELKPDGVEAFNNLGAALRAQGKPAAAEAAYRQALSLRPSADIFGNLGATLRELGKAEEAELAYRQALELAPDFVAAEHNLSLVQLLQGNYEEGFARNEARFGVGTGKRYQELILSSFTGSERWRGESLEGRSLLVVTEQGFGDNFMMMRYLPLLREQNPARLMVCCHREALLRTLQAMPGLDDVVLLEEVECLGGFDLYCPSMSLPFLCGSRLQTIPAMVPYLTVPHGMRGEWAGRLSLFQGKKIGIAWAGCAQNQSDSERSIPLESFAPLMMVKGVHFVSLQEGAAAGELRRLGWELSDWMAECPDFQDTAALVDGLDLIITVDTAVAHLAGALGKPVWLLNRFVSEWRWMLGRSDSPWYPSMKIFRQPLPGDWGSVICQVADELAELFGKGSETEIG